MSLPQGELYRLILENLPVGVYMVDREGKILFWNVGMERITGYLRQDVMGHHCEDGFLEHTDAENNPLAGASVPLLETIREGRLLLRGRRCATKAAIFFRCGYAPRRCGTSMAPRKARWRFWRRWVPAPNSTGAQQNWPRLDALTA
jgi:PAS domain-containing protein